MAAMNVDPLGPWDFGAKYAVKYKEDHHREATWKEVSDAYEGYKKFFYTYRSDHPAAITDCYDEYLETLDKQGKQTRLLGG